MSFIKVDAASDFSFHNLPYGIFSTPDNVSTLSLFQLGLQTNKILFHCYMLWRVIESHTLLVIISNIKPSQRFCLVSFGNFLSVTVTVCWCVSRDLCQGC